MEKLTLSDLEDLQKRADKYIGKTAFVPSSLFNAFGKKGKGDIEVTLVSYTRPRFASKDKHQDEKQEELTYHMPNAKLKNAKGVMKTASLDKIIEYFENQENSQSS